MDTTEDDQDLVLRQQLKAAVHYTVGKICEESEKDLNVKYHRQFIASLSEVTCKKIVSFANDLELFSRHAKRSTVSPEDVKLLVRKSPRLHQHICDLHAELETQREETRKRGKKGKKKPSAQEDADEDSNMVD
ncbi:centromere protein S-like [Liolophura sinensis]|uniref:centromere protein S-like n=1 Tax=Liolophura sinensis TaxID=3198878 RepID=UPI003158B30D